MNKITLTLVAVAAVIIIGAGLAYVFLRDEAPTAADPEAAVATVNGETITRAELDAWVASVGGYPEPTTIDEEQAAAERQDFERLVLEQAINDMLLSADIEARGFSVEEADVDTELATLKGQFESEEAFQTELSAAGLSEADLRAQLEQQLTLQQYYAALGETYDLVVSDEEVQAAYNAQVAIQEDAPALEEVSAQIRAQLEQQKIQNAIASEATRLRSEATIELHI